MTPNLGQGATVRHQINILIRGSAQRASLTNGDRLFFVWLYRLPSGLYAAFDGEYNLFYDAEVQIPQLRCPSRSTGQFFSCFVSVSRSDSLRNGVLVYHADVGR